MARHTPEAAAPSPELGRTRPVVTGPLSEKCVLRGGASPTASPCLRLQGGAMGLVLLLHRIRDPGVVARVKVAQQRVLQQWDQRRPQRLVRVRARVNPNQRGPQHQAVEAVPGQGSGSGSGQGSGQG